jgi:methionine salvage enolase-phosphatase E1
MILQFQLHFQGIYSSGSIQAQKLLFGHTNKVHHFISSFSALSKLQNQGNLLHFLYMHFDTTTGGKLEPESYSKMFALSFPLFFLRSCVSVACSVFFSETFHRAATLKAKPIEILFVSDAFLEVKAADQAGFVSEPIYIF